MSEFYRMLDQFGHLPGWERGQPEWASRQPGWASRRPGWASRQPGQDREPDGPERQKAREGFKDTLTLQFNDIYGTDVNDLAAWQKLCTVLNLPDIPNELEACREVR